MRPIRFARMGRFVLFIQIVKQGQFDQRTAVAGYRVEGDSAGTGQQAGEGFDQLRFIGFVQIKVLNGEDQCAVMQSAFKSIVQSDSCSQFMCKACQRFKFGNAHTESRDPLLSMLFVVYLVDAFDYIDDQIWIVV